MVDMDFLFCGNRFLLFNLFFLQLEDVTEINGPFFWERLYSHLQKGIFCPVETDFMFLSCKWKRLGKQNS